MLRIAKGIAYEMVETTKSECQDYDYTNGLYLCQVMSLRRIGDIEKEKGNRNSLDMIRKQVVIERIEVEVPMLVKNT